jgi:multiple antibiotic resistance protein
MEELVRYGLTSLVTLLVVVDPFGGIVPIFAVLTTGFSPHQRRTILTRAVGIALAVALFFLAAGRITLAYLGVTVHAFAISGGILLFATALPMLFGHRAGLQAPEPEEEATTAKDFSIFPLAIPLLSGPGTLTTILLLTDKAQGDPGRVAALGAAVVAVFGAAWVVLKLGSRLMGWIGEGGLHVITRVMGIVLAALAVQYVLDGITRYYRSVAGR